MVEGAVPGQPDPHDTHAGTVPDPAGRCQPAGSPNQLAAGDVWGVEMPAHRRRPTRVAALPAPLGVLAAYNPG
jgi:hypothetical protein